ncbi:MAG: hypothetical protein ABR521_14105 [Gaiellaceae bacterium]
MKRLATLVPLAALLVAAAGCGGDGGGERLTKAELITQGDAICTSYDARAKPIEERFPNVDPTSDETSEDDVRKFADPLDELNDLYSEQIGELRDLKAPEADEDLWDTALDNLQATLDALADFADAARDADREGIREAVEAGQKSSDAADKIAQDYGFKVCGADD